MCLPHLTHLAVPQITHLAPLLFSSPKMLTPVPPPRSTQIMLLRPVRRAAHAARSGLRPHRKRERNLSSAFIEHRGEGHRAMRNGRTRCSSLQATCTGHYKHQLPPNSHARACGP